MSGLLLHAGGGAPAGAVAPTIRGYATGSEIDQTSDVVIQQADFTVAPQAGDTVCAIMWAALGDTPPVSWNVPAGFTQQVYQDGTFGFALMIATKIAGGAEGAYTFVSPELGNGELVHVLAIKDANGLDDIVPGNHFVTNINTTPAFPPTLSLDAGSVLAGTTVDKCLLIDVWGAGGTFLTAEAWTPPGGTTKIVDTTVASSYIDGSIVAAVGTKALPAAANIGAQTGTVTKNSGNDYFEYIGGCIALKPF